MATVFMAVQRVGQAHFSEWCLRSYSHLMDTYRLWLHPPDCTFRYACSKLLVHGQLS